MLVLRGSTLQAMASTLECNLSQVDDFSTRIPDRAEDRVYIVEFLFTSTTSPLLVTSPPPVGAPEHVFSSHIPVLLLHAAETISSDITTQVIGMLAMF